MLLKLAKLGRWIGYGRVGVWFKVSRRLARLPHPPIWSPKPSTTRQPKMPFQYRASPTDPVTRHMLCNRYRRTLYQPACFMLTCQPPLLQSFMLLLLHTGNRILRLRGITPHIDHHQTLLHFRPQPLQWAHQLAPTLYLLLRANRVINLSIYQS